MTESVKPFIAVFGKIPDVIEQAVAKYSSILGTPDLKSDSYQVDEFTIYYEKEMGKSLVKSLFSFPRLIDPSNLVSLKLLSLEIEKQTSKGGSRQINIDPGYLALSKLVLSSHKDSAQRIYLCSGVFAEITRSYKKNAFSDFEYTYPDYRSPLVTRFFNAMREIYKSQLDNNKFTIADNISIEKSPSSET